MANTENSPNITANPPRHTNVLAPSQSNIKSQRGTLEPETDLLEYEDDDIDDDEDDEFEDFLSPTARTVSRETSSRETPLTQDDNTETSQTLEDGEEFDETLYETGTEVDVGKAAEPEGVRVETWDNGEEVTVAERAALLGMDTDEARARTMIIRSRERQLLKDGEIGELTPIIPQPSKVVKKGPAKAKKGKAVEKPKGVVPEKQKDSDRGTRRNDRHKPSTSPPLPAPGGDSDSLPPAVPISTVSTSLNADEEGLPEWIDEALLHLNAMCDDGEWAALLVKWIELESLMGFPKGRVS